MKPSDLLVGIHAVESALRHDASSIVEVLVEQGAGNRRVKELVDAAREAGVAIHTRPLEFLDKATGGARHQGVIARWTPPAELVEADLPKLVEAAGAEALVLILDGVQDPHNLGACLRSAEAAGVTAVVMPRDRAVGITPTVRTASAGAADRVPVVRVINLARSIEALKSLGVWITGLAGEGTNSLYAVDFKGPVGIAVGGESDGLRRLTRDLCDHLAKIPMRGDVESLNVSVATGIALFEVLRQRGGA
jgi:23S rRNA (guanosine2251-2'-O)-methyltransferase